MNAGSLAVKFGLVTSLAVAAPCLWAHDGLLGALPRANFSAPFGPTLAVADFDNDKRADGAVVVDSGRLNGQHDVRVEIHLSGRGNTTLSVQSNDTTQAVSAWDIDHDGDTDVIVQQPVTEQRLHVWLNDGSGGFHEGRIEDFPSPAVPAREHLNPPARDLQIFSFALPPQRGSEVGMLLARRVSGHPSLACKVQSLSTDCAPVCPASLPNPPRAPPLPHSH